VVFPALVLEYSSVHWVDLHLVVAVAIAVVVVAVVLHLKVVDLMVDHCLYLTVANNNTMIKTTYDQKI